MCLHTLKVKLLSLFDIPYFLDYRPQGLFTGLILKKKKYIGRVHTIGRTFAMNFQCDFRHFSYLYAVTLVP
jgi:hypothetical protein